MSQGGHLETREYIGISLIRVIKELAGRVRLLEELVQSQPQLKAAYDKSLSYRAAFEEDEYTRLIDELRSVLEKLPEMEGLPDQDGED
jgi:hypothetical protein